MLFNERLFFATVWAAKALQVTALPSCPLPTATLANGDTLRGSCCPNTSATMFRGIPYAQPPLDNLRFMPPKPLSTPLTNSSYPQFDATNAAPPCLQYVYLDLGVQDTQPTEDCLTLDVYVPPNIPKGAKLPVKVWAYGGYNQVGGTSYPLYDSCTLATDAIVVEMNYRLGPMGFLSLTSAGVQGNMGIQDQLAALEWVQTNIEYFSGDKSRVMMFGESSGADDAWIISTMPEAKGLISSVILQSGGGQIMTPLSDAQTVGESFASLAGCDKFVLSCLQQASTETISNAYSNLPEINNFTIGVQRLTQMYRVFVPGGYNMWTGVLDGKVIRDEPLLVGPKVPLVAGATETDGTLLTVPFFLESDGPVDERNYTDLINAFGPELGPQVAQMYPLSRFDLFNDTTAAVIAAASHIATQSLVCPAYFAVRSAEVSLVSSYAYRFNHIPSCPWLRIPELGEFPTGELSGILGPTHTSEIPFVFGGLDKMPFGNGTCNSTESEYQMSEQLIKSWTAAASTGSPATTELKWPKFDDEQSYGLLVNERAEITKLDFAECGLWSTIWQTLGETEIPYL